MSVAASVQPYVLITPTIGMSMMAPVMRIRVTHSGVVVNQNSSSSPSTTRDRHCVPSHHHRPSSETRVWAIHQFWARVGFAQMMRSRDVIEVLDALDAVGVPVVIEGGWGVDALLGSTTRDHSDLDVALERSLLPLAQVVLEKLGFDHAAAAEPGLPARFVMKDGRGRQVDLHPLVFDEAGNG